jgi:hypothetical protein
LFGGREIVDRLGDESAGDGAAIQALSFPSVGEVDRQMLLDAYDRQNADPLLELGCQGFVQAFFQSRDERGADRAPDFCYNVDVSTSCKFDPARPSSTRSTNSHCSPNYEKGSIDKMKLEKIKRVLPILLDTLYALALSLWFGLAAGLLVIAHSGTPDVSQSLFAQRASGLIEAAGVAMIGVQFLLRRRYGRNRPLAAADGVRQLLTFGALFLAEFGRYHLLNAGTALTAHQYSVLCQLAGVQMLALAIVTALTSWLFVPRGR